MKTIIFYRETRGIGDAIMFLRTVELWRKKEPEAEIVVVMKRPASAVLENHPDIDLITESIDITDYQNAKFFNISNCCLDYETTAKHIEKDRFKLFAEACNIDFDGEAGTIHITDTEKQYLHDKFFAHNRQLFEKTLIGIVLKSAQEFRNYPHTKKIINYFHRLNKYFNSQYVPIIIDPDENPDEILSTHDLDIRETICLISKLDLVIGPDTGPMHIAGAFGVPTLWLFGPTDPQMRATYYEHSHWIQGKCPTDNQPCWYQYCEHISCLWNISPLWQVVRTAKGILNAKEQK